MATLASVKARLTISASDTSKDGVINRLLAAANLYVTQRTGLELKAAESARVDTFRNVAEGRTLLLSRRPVASVTKAEVAVPAKTLTWTEIGYSLVDPAAGEVTLIGEIINGASAWPPTPGVEPWMRWRRTRWQLARVTYATTLYAPPADLDMVIDDLVAHWFSTGRASHLQSASLGDITEVYRGKALPPHIEGPLSAYERGQVLWA